MAFYDFRHRFGRHKMEKEKQFCDSNVFERKEIAREANAELR